jgi:SPP1 gp7 family putative phage head morphogenesis protein
MQRHSLHEGNLAIESLTSYRRDIIATLMETPGDTIGSNAPEVLQTIGGLTGLALMRNALQLDALAAASSEASYTVKLLSSASTVPFLPATQSAIAVGLSAAMPVAAGSVPDVLAAFEAAKKAQIIQVIKDGITIGESTPRIARQVSTIMDTLITRQTRAVVNTIISHASSVGRLATYNANRNLLDQYRWVATLDGLTSLICMSRDGVLYDIGVGPMPPAHFNCRSTTVPVIRPENDLGIDLKGKRPSIGSDGAQQVGSRTTYGGWLRRQSKSFVDEALGVERSRLFRTQNMEIDKFVDPTGKAYTLKQLESMDNLTFSDN